jgi:flagellar biosynthetic protein FlhB
VLANYVQVGILFTTEPLKPSLSKINPLNGLKNMFSLKKLVELVKNLIKIILIGIYGWLVIKDNSADLLKMPYMDFMQGFILMYKVTYDMIVSVAFVLFIIAVIDYFYQRWEFEKSIRMSKQEIKEEYKQMEGDPQIKSKMRAMQRSMIRKRMLQEVPKATVIITNPTHLSIAVKYEAGMRAPVVLAKGADYLAMRIREIAKENNIPIVENKPLAQALYKIVEIEQEIPEEYYRAVAEILSIIYKKKG